MALGFVFIVSLSSRMRCKSSMDVCVCVCVCVLLYLNTTATTTRMQQSRVANTHSDTHPTWWTDASAYIFPSHLHPARRRRRMRPLVPSPFIRRFGCSLAHSAHLSLGATSSKKTGVSRRNRQRQYPGTAPTRPVSALACAGSILGRVCVCVCVGAVSVINLRSELMSSLPGGE